MVDGRDNAAMRGRKDSKEKENDQGEEDEIEERYGENRRWGL